MKKSKKLLFAVCILLLGSLLSSCISLPALKNISPEVKVGFKRVGVVVLVNDIMPTHELVREKGFFGGEYEIASSMNALTLAPGALDQAVTDAVSVRFGPGVTVVSIPTTQDEKEILWDGIEGLSYLPRKNRLSDRLREISARDNLDLIVLIRDRQSQPMPVLHERTFYGLAFVYRANKDGSGGTYNIMTSLAVELLEAKSMKSLDMKPVYDFPVLPFHETQYGWNDLRLKQGEPEISRNVSLGIGKRVAVALEGLGF